MSDPENSPEKAPDLLTGIQPSYTLASTEEGRSEVEEIMIKDFLNTLAEVSLSIATRKQRELQ